MEENQFIAAKPIWPYRRSHEKNITVGFRAMFDKPLGDLVIFRIAAASLYRFFLNGSFVGHGPARGPHGYYRVDEWDLTEKLLEGQNILAVEVTSYNINSYYILDQPGFIQAEVVVDRKVIVLTSGKANSFEAAVLKERIQKVERYSIQRTFIEAYQLEQGYDSWREDAAITLKSVAFEEVSPKKLIPRRVAYPEFSVRKPIMQCAAGQIETGRVPESYWKDRALTNIGPMLKGYMEEELETIPSQQMQEIITTASIETNIHFSEKRVILLAKKSFCTLDFGMNLTGFIGARITCNCDTKILFVFDEILHEGDVDFKRLQCINVVSWEVKAGDYDIETFEPYTLRYLKWIVLDGQCEIERVYLREYTNPDVYNAHFRCDNEALNRIYEAGRETFRQNAVDIYMDCPSRERAGWLCDSFFASRVEYELTGKSMIEKNFLENFLLPDQFAHLPDGMLPMCYPADHYDGTFIPNWALWFVIELEEYLARSGDRLLVDELKPKVLKLFDYFALFQNEFGLLEKLESWIFVEWSKAQDFVQDVNYPTNMLYAAALETAGRLYDIRSLMDQAVQLKKTIGEQSFDGQFFADNAVREDGKLKVMDNRTEVCQYYAFYFGVATAETHGKLWNILLQSFGPERKNTGAFVEIHPANAFIGNYLRLELLSFHNCNAQLLKELEGFFTYMVERTGTLWEHNGDYASCNHGFASHVVHCLYRDALGIHQTDIINRTIKLRFHKLPLQWCEGEIPLEDEHLFIKWRVEGNTLYYSFREPLNYHVYIENLSEKKLVKEMYMRS